MDYFSQEGIFDYGLIGKEVVYAHRYGERVETLEEHSNLCLKYFYKLESRSGISDVFKKIEEELDIRGQDRIFFRQMIIDSIYMHDIGKINLAFQYKKMKNLSKGNIRPSKLQNSNHSSLSTLLYLDYSLKKLKKLKQVERPDLLIVIAILNAYVISKHHGSHDSLNHFKEKLEDIHSEINTFRKDYGHLYEYIYSDDLVYGGEPSLSRLAKTFEVGLSDCVSLSLDLSKDIYVYERLLSSILFSCDYYATSEFISQKEVDYLDKPSELRDYYGVFKKTDIYKSIREQEENRIEDFKGARDINVVRNELFSEAEKNFLKNLDKNIFYLEAPTGSGKSNVAFNLSLRASEVMEKVDKVFYVYPFNTLIEQNLDTLKNVFGDEKLMEGISVVNSIVPIKSCKLTNSKEVYRTALLDRQFLHYPVVLTTNISFFRYLFGVEREDIFSLAHMVNSVVVLDEIQSYKNSIWTEIMMFLSKYSELLNIRVIIMSATLPKLDELLDGEVNAVSLITNSEKYFLHPLFKDRVRVDYSLLDMEGEVREVRLDRILEHVKSNYLEKKSKIVLEFIKKKTAIRFYKMLKDDLDMENKTIELMTGDDNRATRRKVIDKVRAEEDIILVATQVIEAGIDIDMDIGYKDISMLDSEEQLLGRVNRSCKKTGSVVYFFDMDRASGIYRGDVRKNKSFTLERLDMRNLLEKKMFKEYYRDVFSVLREKSNELNKNNIENFLREDVGKLDFQAVESRMTLIDKTYEKTVFFDVVVESEDGRLLYGREVWNRYKDILKDGSLDYAEKRVKLSEIRADMDDFLYDVRKEGFVFEDRIGSLFFVPKANEFFTEDGKFDREEFEADCFI